MEENKLHRAIRLGNTKQALKHVASGRFDLGQLNEQGLTPLQNACLNGRRKVVLALIATGQADIGRVCIIQGGDVTALYLTCWMFDTNSVLYSDIAVILIRTGEANLNYIGYIGYGARIIMCACEQKMYDVVRALVDAEVELEYTTPYHISIKTRFAHDSTIMSILEPDGLYILK